MVCGGHVTDRWTRMNGHFIFTLGSVQFQACLKAASVSPSTAEGPSDLSHGDPIASLVTALSDIKLRPRTRQNNKQPSTIRDDARTHTVKCSIYVHLGHHKDTVKCGDAKRHSSMSTLSALCHRKIILGRELSSRSLPWFRALSQLDTGPDQLPLDTKTELTKKRGEDTGLDISACLASLSKLSINSGQKVHQKDVRKKVPLHTVMLPTMLAYICHKPMLQATSRLL
ncbi:hypothetical protein BU17DRAFT_69108 [Hysterangium stoloniferum]|nr:hypothetical protein BU17DRAFT_69108 [Hysterangium stoloniferum]